MTGHPYPRQESKAAVLLADTLNNRALSLLDLGKPLDAEEAWQRALAVDPHHLDSVYNLGLFEWRVARADDVTLAERLREAEATTAVSQRLALLAAQMELESGDCKAALSLLEQLEAKAQAHPEVLSLLAYTREHLPVSRRLLRTLEGHIDFVLSVCLSADGHYALSGGLDTTLKLWEVSSGRCLRTFVEHSLRVNSVYLSADGGYALSGGDDKTLKLWEVSSGRCLRTFEDTRTP